MAFRLPLSCSANDLQEFKKHSTAILAATRIFNDYCRDKKMFLGTGPELYAESWMKIYLQSFNKEMEDLIVVYFIKLLLKTQKDKESPGGSK